MTDFALSSCALPERSDPEPSRTHIDHPIEVSELPPDGDLDPAAGERRAGPVGLERLVGAGQLQPDREHPRLDGVDRHFEVTHFDRAGLVDPVDLTDAELAGTINRLQALNVNFVSLNPIWMAETSDSTESTRAPVQWTPGIGFTSITDEQLVTLIDLAHRSEIAVALKPMVFLNDGSWVGNMELSDEWFENYTDNVLIPMAQLGEEHGVEMLVLLNDSADQNAYGDVWAGIVAQVRAIFAGQLSLADSDFPDRYCCSPPVAFRDELDVYGFQGYLPGSGHGAYPAIAGVLDTTVDEMIANMVPHYDARETEATGSNLKAVNTEMGILNADGANRAPADLSYDRENWQVDNQEQVDYYEAVLRVFTGRPWMRGAFIWTTLLNSAPFDEDPGLGITSDIKGVPVQDLVRIWFKTD